MTENCRRKETIACGCGNHHFTDNCHRSRSLAMNTTFLIEGTSNIREYSLPTKDSDTEVLELDTRNKLPLCQGYIYEEIHNSNVKCCDPSEGNAEFNQRNLQKGLVTLSAVGRCIRNAIDSLLGMDPFDSDRVLETTDSQFMELTTFDSQKQVSFLKAEVLDGNIENKSESKRENLESEKTKFKQDSILSRSLRNNSSETSTLYEEHNFNTCINAYRTHEQNLPENDTKSKHTGRKLLKGDICQRILTNKGNLHRHLSTHSREKSFQCEVCQRRFARKQNLLRHMRTHDGEKPFECEVCQRTFARKQHLFNHMRAHNPDKYIPLRSVSAMVFKCR
ncbi:hypothetical protein NPIL_457701 [Nephila pilipes]|uniref:C2H2-type domain-containing protein n=1 Tax=Nephila pilipes TaxID=299642 RepID=A0A8X6MVV6_NEPPI|nr:hypothetical protein NPIL_457701 [Nephila pilipes]